MSSGAASTGRSKPKRKRSRKTRTAIVSDASSSSSSSSSDSSSESSDNDTPSIFTKPATISQTKESESESDSNSDAQSVASGSTLSSTLPETKLKQTEGKRDRLLNRNVQSPPPEIKQDFSDSSDDEMIKLVTLDSKCRALRPSTPVLRSELIEGAAQKRREAMQVKNEKKAAILAKQSQTASNSATREEDFQAIWMRLMVDEFGEELDALRKKEPNLTTEGGNRMPLLIDALQAGSEVFSRGVDSSSSGKILESDEVGLMLWSKERSS